MQPQVRAAAPRSTVIGGVRAFLAVVPMSLVVFGFVLDSGGELGLRIYAFLLLCLLTARHFRRLHLSAQEVLWWTLPVGLLLPSLLIALWKSVALGNIIIWIVPVVMFPLILAAARSTSITAEHFINGGLLFACLVIALFFGRLNAIEPLIAVHEFLSERSAGFFNQKETFFDEAMPVVYFQGTLNLLTCAILAISRKRYLTYVVASFALLIAPSRFGFTLAIVFGLLFLALSIRKRAIFWLVVGASCVLGAVFFQVLPDTFREIFSSGSDGSKTRWLHAESVYDLFEMKPYAFLFGDGPGTSFFSRGFNDMTDNIEVSQLEMLRKFGLPFSLFITGFFVWLCRRLFLADEAGLALALAAHYLVALSNPVLFSLPATFMAAVAIIALQKRTSSTCHASSPSS